MQKKFFKVLTLSLITILLLNSNSAVFAANGANNERKSEKVLLDAGYPQATIDQLSEVDKQELYQVYLKYPDKTTFTSTVLEVDVLAEIDSYVNLTYDQKIKTGATDEKIKEADKEIESLREMSNEEIKNKFMYDDVRVKLLREALEPDTDSKARDEVNDVNASGSITASEMTLTLTTTNYSTSTQTNYWNYISFSWSDWYFFGIFNDKIPIAWGGNLLFVPISNNINYYYQPQSSWGGYSQSAQASYIETTINAGGYYQFPQTISGDKAKFGSFTFYIKQNGRYNTLSKIITQFAHQILTIGSSDISVSGAPTISIGAAYDTSAQLSNQITY